MMGGNYGIGKQKTKYIIKMRKSTYVNSSKIKRTRKNRGEIAFSRKLNYESTTKNKSPVYKGTKTVFVPVVRSYG